MSRPTRRGPLRAHELAEAAVLADVALLCLLLARLTPFGSISPVVAAVPIAVLAARRRRRAVVVGSFVLVVLTFLLAGFGTSQSALVAVLWGSVAGVGFRRRWSIWTQIGWSVVVGWTVVATATLTTLSLLVGFRELALDQARAQVEGLATILRTVGLTAPADSAVDIVDRAIRWWWVTIPIFQLVISVALAVLVRRVAAPSLRRIAAVPVADVPDLPDAGPAGPTDGDGPVPVAVRGVSVRRGGRRVLAGVDLDVRSGEVIVLAGPNGSGKSTLLGVLGGRLPVESGEITRPGPVDLGRPGGTGWIGQRPETQVIGARVIDDLAWGLSAPPAAAEAARALAAVGLAGWEDRDTSGLSGGEQQRLALAAVLVRRPRLVLSDESTAMIDPAGRELVRRALRRAADDGAAVVHVSHLDEDLAIADRVVRFDTGGATTSRPGTRT